MCWIVFLTDGASPTWSGCIISENSRRWSAASTCTAKTGVCSEASQKLIMWPLLFEGTVTAKNPKLWLSSLLCWKKIKGAAGFKKLGRPPTLRKQQLACRISSVIALSSVNFCHHDHRTLCHVASYCGDFLNELKQNSKSVEDIKLTINRLLLAVTTNFEKKLQKMLWKRRIFVFKNVWDVWGICCNYTLCITFRVSLKA